MVRVGTDGKGRLYRKPGKKPLLPRSNVGQKRQSTEDINGLCGGGERGSWRI